MTRPFKLSPGLKERQLPIVPAQLHQPASEAMGPAVEISHHAASVVGHPRLHLHRPHRRRQRDRPRLPGTRPAVDRSQCHRVPQAAERPHPGRRQKHRIPAGGLSENGLLPGRKSQTAGREGTRDRGGSSGKNPCVASPPLSLSPPRQRERTPGCFPAALTITADVGPLSLSNI